jgi:hypothetical protein
LNTRAAAGARKAEANHGEMEAAGEVGVGARASAAWAWATPMRETTVKMTAMRATTGVLERAIGVRLFYFSGHWNTQTKRESRRVLRRWKSCSCSDCLNRDFLRRRKTENTIPIDEASIKSIDTIIKNKKVNKK